VFTYRNQPRFPLTDFVNKGLILAERSLIGITVVEGISQELINNAIHAWMVIFNEHIPATGDGNMLFDNLLERLKKAKDDWQKVKNEYEGFPFVKSLSEVTDKLAELLTIRDPKRLFENLNNDAAAMASLIDRCRNIKDFTDHSFADYKEIKRYCENNEENFHQLDKENREKVKLIKEFFHSEDPSNDFRTYKKIHKELKDAVTSKIKTLKEETRSRYEQIFDQLNTLANENNLAPATYANREYKLKQIEGLNSITTLQLTLSRADRFLSDERSKILLEADRVEQERKQRELEQKHREDIAKGRVPKTPVPDMVASPPVNYVLPKPQKILSTETEVEDYIEGIRKKMLEMINNNQKILIQ